MSVRSAGGAEVGASGLRVTAAYSSLNLLVQYLLYALSASAADDLTSLLE